jgi:hypothetical protein
MGAFGQRQVQEFDSNPDVQIDVQGLVNIIEVTLEEFAQMAVFRVRLHFEHVFLHL